VCPADLGAGSHVPTGGATKQRVARQCDVQLLAGVIRTAVDERALAVITRPGNSDRCDVVKLATTKIQSGIIGDHHGTDAAKTVVAGVNRATANGDCAAEAGRRGEGQGTGAFLDQCAGATEVSWAGEAECVGAGIYRNQAWEH